jgi:hypothetical protein
MSCPFCSEHVDRDADTFDEHLRSCDEYAAYLAGAQRKPLFRLLCGDGTSREYVYVGFDGLQARERFDQIAKRDRLAAALLQGPLVVARYDTTAGVSVDVFRRPVNKGRTVAHTPTPAPAPVDPHAYCRYVGTCVPHLRAAPE